MTKIDRKPERWELLFRDWPLTEEPYTLDMWQEMLDGAFESLKNFTGLEFRLMFRPYVGLDDEPYLCFGAAYQPDVFPDTVLPSLSYRAFCTFGTRIGDHLNKNEISFFVEMYNFIGSLQMSVDKEEYIAFALKVSEDGTTDWISHAWSSGEADENAGTGGYDGEPLDWFDEDSPAPGDTRLEIDDLNRKPLDQPDESSPAPDDPSLKIDGFDEQEPLHSPLSGRYSGAIPEKIARRPETWELLLRNQLRSKEPYTLEMWQEIFGGVFESFNRFTKHEFKLLSPPKYDLEKTPSVRFETVFHAEYPPGSFLPPLSYKGIACISSWEKYPGEFGITIEVKLFHYIGEKRARSVEVSRNHVRDDFLHDYLLFKLEFEEDGTTEWKRKGWKSGFPGEWDEIKRFDDALLFESSFRKTNNFVPEIHICPKCRKGVLRPWKLNIHSRDNPPKETFWKCPHCSEFRLEIDGNILKKRIDPVEYLSLHYPECFEINRYLRNPYFEFIQENVPPRPPFPEGSEDIMLYLSNTLTIYECRISTDNFRKWTEQNETIPYAIGKSEKIPRYNFRKHLERGSYPVPKLEEIEREFYPCVPFIETVKSGFAFRSDSEGAFVHFTYDNNGNRLYYYIFMKYAGTGAFECYSSWIELYFHRMFYPEQVKFEPRTAESTNFSAFD